MGIEKLHTPDALVQKDMIDFWMAAKGYPVLSIDGVVELMGGVGETRCKTIDDALARPLSNPGRWFTSEQTDDSFYSDPSYVYDNWFVAHIVSAPAYGLAAKLMKDRVIYDVGGTVFNAFQMVKDGAYHVITVNLPGTPAAEFNRWCVDGGLVERTTFQDVAPESYVGTDCVFSEFFEHFPNVDDTFSHFAKCNQFIAANAFCVAAHGHYIPIVISKMNHSNRKSADESFVSLVRSHGYSVRTYTLETKKILHCTRNSLML